MPWWVFLISGVVLVVGFVFGFLFAMLGADWYCAETIRCQSVRLRAERQAFDHDRREFDGEREVTASAVEAIQRMQAMASASAARARRASGDGVIVDGTVIDSTPGAV